MKYREHIRDNIQAFMIFTFNLNAEYLINFKTILNPILVISSELRKIFLQVIAPITEIFGAFCGGINDKEYLEKVFEPLKDL
jgi:hypothetical protein